MGLDEEISKSKRDGDIAKVITLKVRAGIISTQLVSLAAQLGHPSAIEAAERLDIKFVPTSTDMLIYNWRVWATRRHYLTSVVRAIVRHTPRGPEKPTNLHRRLAISYACDVVEHSLYIFEEKYPGNNFPHQCMALARDFTTGHPADFEEMGILHHQYVYDVEVSVPYCENTVSHAADTIIFAIMHYNETYDSIVAALAIIAGAYNNEAKEDESLWQMYRLAEYALGDI